MNIKTFGLVLLLAGLCGCAGFLTVQPSAESHGVGLSWQGAPAAELLARLDRPPKETDLGDGRREYSWRKERTVTGPPRTEFGPGGRIKTRPGSVTWTYCDGLATVGADGRIESLEFTGGCSAELLPPAWR